MFYKDYLTLKNEVLRETDTEGEEFIQPQEVLDYFNDGVREALAIIQKLGLEDDYFQKSVKYDLTAGLTELDLPLDIYAAKIRGLIYATPSLVYPIKRIKGKDKFEIIQQILQYPSSNSYYVYDLENASPTTGFKIKLYPVSYEDIPQAITLNYVRTVVPVALDTDLVDIPEFYSFIKAFVKMKIYSKENSDKAVGAKADYDAEKQLMVDTLAEMTPDYDNKIIGDYSPYTDHT
jgi:hypothetical protein